MGKKILRYIIIVCFMVSFLGVCALAEEITRGDFIVRLVESMGLAGRLQEGAPVQDYVTLLRKEGLKIPVDYDLSKPITVEEKADLLSQALTVERKEKERGRDLMESYRNKAIVIKIVGSVMVKLEGAAEWIPAKLDMELTQGAYIKTGEASSASLRVGVAGRIEIKENTEVLLQTLATRPDKRSENILLYLAMGEVFVDVRDIEEGSKFETYTPTTVAAVRGTTYVVTVEPASGKTEVREEVR